MQPNSISIAHRTPATASAKSRNRAHIVWALLRVAEHERWPCLGGYEIMRHLTHLHAFFPELVEYKQRGMMPTNCQHLHRPGPVLPVELTFASRQKPPSITWSHTHARDAWLQINMNATTRDAARFEIITDGTKKLLHISFYGEQLSVIGSQRKPIY